LYLKRRPFQVAFFNILIYALGLLLSLLSKILLWPLRDDPIHMAFLPPSNKLRAHRSNFRWCQRYFGESCFQDRPPPSCCRSIPSKSQHTLCRLHSNTGYEFQCLQEERQTILPELPCMLFEWPF